MEAGILTKNMGDNIIRFAPPLVITREQVEKAADIITKTVLDFAEQQGRTGPETGG